MAEGRTPASRRRQGDHPPVIAAYYYPGWHACAQRRVHGTHDEWALLYGAAARHLPPEVRRPRAGPVPTTVRSLEREVAQAMAGGIDAFIWCWYWDRGVRHLNAALDLYHRCDLPPDFRYALMWVNKRPHFDLPVARPASRRSHRERFVDTDEADFRAMVRHLIDDHWTRSSYLCVDRRPLLPVYCVEPLARRLGQARLADLLAAGQDMAVRAGFAGVCYVAVVHRLHARRWRLARRLGLGLWCGAADLAATGFAAATSYIYLPDWDGPPRQSYRELVDRRAGEWASFEAGLGLPYWPSLSPGWDARPRGAASGRPADGYPWASVVVGESPAEFARLLGHWKSYAAAAHPPPPILPVASWNEWTEGHAVAPCDHHGDGYLRALRAFKDSWTPPASPASPLQRPVLQPALASTAAARPDTR